MTRTLKQVIYGAIYVFFLVAIFYGGYRVTLKPPASCSDNSQNRDETGVDCGGAYCISCAIKTLKPIQISQVQLLPSADGSHVNAIVELLNPNAAYGADSFSFTLTMYGSSSEPIYTEDTTAPVYPSELQDRLYINLPIAYSPLLRADATSTAVSWASLTDLVKPRTPIREVHTTIDVTGQRATITGIVQNNNAFALHRITINGVLTNGPSDIVGLSKTVVQDVGASEERFFQLIVPFLKPVAQTALLNPKITIQAEQ